MTATKRYGFCVGSGDWIVGYLLDRCPDHPDQLTIIASHISSSEGWSEHDVRVFHHENKHGGGPFEWLGHVASDDQLDERSPLPVCTKDQHAEPDGTGSGEVSQ